MTKCAVTEDLNRHLAKLDEQEQYEGALEKAKADLIDELISGEIEDEALYDEVMERIDHSLLIRYFLNYEKQKSSGIFNHLKNHLLGIVNQRAHDLAFIRVEAERDAAEEDEAERKAEAKGLI